MQKMNVKKEPGFTRYVIIGDLYQGSDGGLPIGKARITYHVPKKKGDGKDIKLNEADKSYDAWAENLVRYIEMDVLFFSAIEKGWVDYFIGIDDIPQGKIDSLKPDEPLIANVVNEYLAENGFGIWVR